MAGRRDEAGEEAGRHLAAHEAKGRDLHPPRGLVRLAARIAHDEEPARHRHQVEVRPRIGPRAGSGPERRGKKGHGKSGRAKIHGAHLPHPQVWTGHARSGRGSFDLPQNPVNEPGDLGPGHRPLRHHQIVAGIGLHPFGEGGHEQLRFDGVPDDRPASKHHALSGDRRLDRQIVIVEPQARAGLDIVGPNHREREIRSV